MDLSAFISLVSSHNADPSATPDHSVDEAPVQIVIGRNMPSKKSVKVVSIKGAQAAPIHKAPTVFGVAMPDKGTLTASAFMAAMRDAGKRSFQALKPNGDFHTVVKVDPSQVRNDQIQAIHSFYYEVRNGLKVHVGYNPTVDFGAQDVASRALAMREIGGKVIAKGSRAEDKSAARSLHGFIAGMPLPSQRLLANLQARETAAVDALIAAQSDEERTMHESVLKQVRQAIDQLVG